VRFSVRMSAEWRPCSDSTGATTVKDARGWTGKDILSNSPPLRPRPPPAAGTQPSSTAP
jgi:hypothetical protein